MLTLVVGQLATSVASATSEDIAFGLKGGQINKRTKSGEILILPSITDYFN
jgi:hypothetical protein